MNIIDKESSEEESIGPKLPQHLKNSKRDYSKTESFHIGPQLPDHLTREKSKKILEITYNCISRKNVS
jgi:hypothetical protein